ncbi:magnesium transporter [Alcanivorax quisquiliarum]|uniref:Magnesium transporter MgtE n=1 Tax=Alcanivorax quisquiliarum TaxID=2933565 RepID=A0ABT0E4W3_9GAMM|nr:magnesium transporter [Alcanivorax quisquiliarum]MCK0536860.1 magnesium transporter [Alcanivorax quisquiliarum]
MTVEELVRALNDAVARDEREAIAERAAELNPADVADFIQQVRPELEVELLMALPLEKRAETFGYLSLQMQQQIASRLPPDALTAMVTKMPSDERADLFKVLDDAIRRRLFTRLARKEREDLRRLASYEEGTAGALMTSDYASVSAGLSVAAALETLRLTAPDKETIYQAFVLDQDHRLQGVISLRQLILAVPSAKVDDLMERDVVAADVKAPQEEVARLISRYDLLALPILNSDNTLVGIVTYDDAMDVAEAEATEDMHKGATVGRLETSLRDASPLSLYRSRVHWLVVLVFGNIFTGAGIAFFEETISAHIALLFFMPLLVASAGNAGAQSATLMVRGLATGDVTARDWGKLLGREILVAGALGLTMAATVMIVGIFRVGLDIALVVALTMVLVVMVGSLIGMGLPFLLDRLKFDPATASTPLITTIADVSGVMIYFGLATVLLGL